MENASLRAEIVHLHGMVDHQVGGQQRIGQRRIGTHGGERIAHGGQIDYAGTPVKSCSSTRAGMKLISLAFAPAPRATYSTSAADHLAPVFLPQQVFEQNLGGKGQAGDVADPGFLQSRQPEDLVLSLTNAQRRRGAKRIFAGHSQFSFCHSQEEGYTTSIHARWPGAPANAAQYGGGVNSDHLRSRSARIIFAGETRG